ncbi:hypothetical protein BJ508DRAFT_332914 [Ascobolus immersus RN42]|uniref:CCHC-type domain-containing protein n=1 Tax=Ascobolus immersus RN42 TaxID=1160509 RepID=A0A3N4HMY8_ASCIM|nr:hypothetical protein BJ508DRAFT_332914 [Ascobolus immersus RN42]
MAKESKATNPPLEAAEESIIITKKNASMDPAADTQQRVTPDMCTPTKKESTPHQVHFDEPVSTAESSTAAEKGKPIQKIRRRSSLYFSALPDGGQSVEWFCETKRLNTYEVEQIRRDDPFRGLQHALNDSNEELHFDLEDLAATYTEEDEVAGPDHMGAAINHKFEEIRLRAQMAVDTYEETVATAAMERQQLEDTLKDLRSTIQKLSTENSQLLQSVSQITADAAAKAKKPDRFDAYPPFDFGDGWSASEKSPLSASCIPDISIPKSYRAQVQANPLKMFEGSSEIEVIFSFLKTLEHHARLIRPWTDIQRIEYAISYLQGAAQIWAIDEWYPQATLTWANFIAAFRRRWIPANARVHLHHKLARMELKGVEVDRFNDLFVNTLNLLDVGNLDTIFEGNQYYSTYWAKIRDPNIISMLTQINITTEGGLTLDQLMRYTAKLMAAKLTAAGPKPAAVPPTTTPSQRNTNQKPQKKHHSLHTISNDENEEHEESLNAVQAGPSNNATTAKKPSGSPGTPSANYNSTTPRLCYVCEQPGHIMRNCELRKEWVKRAKSEN